MRAQFWVETSPRLVNAELQFSVESKLSAVSKEKTATIRCPVRNENRTAPMRWRSESD
jgi:hypothetical protein